jgi:hypothetical protein
MWCSQILEVTITFSDLRFLERYRQIFIATAENVRYAVTVVGAAFPYDYHRSISIIAELHKGMGYITKQGGNTRSTRSWDDVLILLFLGVRRVN